MVKIQDLGARRGGPIVKHGTWGTGGAARIVKIQVLVARRGGPIVKTQHLGVWGGGGGRAGPGRAGRSQIFPTSIEKMPLFASMREAIIYYILYLYVYSILYVIHILSNC